jgi:hypothetical protein
MNIREASQNIVAGTFPKVTTNNPFMIILLGQELRDKWFRLIGLCKTDTEKKHMDTLYDFLMSDNITDEFSILVMRELIRSELKIPLIISPHWVKWAKKHKDLVLSDSIL